MTEIDRLQIELHRWANQTFGTDRPPRGAIAHLQREVKELAEAPHDVWEYVDCLTLLLDAMSNAEITIARVLDCSWEKLDINRHREWGEVQEDGTIEHVRGTTVTCPHSKWHKDACFDFLRVCDACGHCWVGDHESVKYTLAEHGQNYR